MKITRANPVTQIPAAPSAEALRRFEARLTFETDCADVHHALENGLDGFVVFDVRGKGAFAAGHVPGAVHLPYGRITEAALAAFSPETLFVTYCAGPHCNASLKAALRIAGLGRPVKEMVGGVEGWKDEGFELAR